VVSKAIVLSGGGSVGIAWQTGLVAGLAAEGVDVSNADLVVGTSAGSAVGAQIALGRDMQKAMQRFARPAASSDAPRTDAPQSAPARASAGSSSSSTERTGNMFAIMAKAAAEGSDPKQVRALVGRFALEASTMSEEQFLRGFAYLANERWPRAFSCTAVDAESGKFMVWNEASGVELVRAVGSSCAVPGLFPPITLNGRRYMDGGTRSGLNADLAKGHERVLLLTLMGNVPGGGGGEDNPRFARMQRARERELTILRDAGGTVCSVEPDAEAAAVMGMDLMNPALIHDAAHAGLRQGRAEAGRLRDFWR
jgi:NTE family protein